MSRTLRLLDVNEKFLQEIEVRDKNYLVEFIFYYGRLFQRIEGTDNFKLKQYLEIY